MIDPARISQYINTEAKHIAGWFFTPDMISFYLLALIQKAMGVGGHCCEVGVYHGKSLVLLSLLKAENEYLFAYDLFHGEALHKTKLNLETYGNSKNIEYIQGNTSDYTQAMLDEKLGGGIRLLHIDAGHEYHEVLQQLLQFTPYVISGGIIIMDDYQDREFPGIEAAVLDFAEYDRPRRFTPFFAGGNKMYLCEAHLAGAYQEALLRTQELKDICRLTRVRDFNVLVGFSKLSVAAEKCLELLRTVKFPAYYDQDVESLANKSRRFQQLRFGSGL